MLLSWTSGFVRICNQRMIRGGWMKRTSRSKDSGKQCCGAERAQVRSSRAQRNHIGLAIRAFFRLELHWFATGISWYQAKLAIMRDAVRAYLAAPRFLLDVTA